MNKLHICLDNGHGVDTPGKRSPDGRLLEYEYAREIVQIIKDNLKDYVNFEIHIITPEKTDISLKERCNRANTICKQYGSKNCIFISVHNNAAGNGGWMSARGWSGWIYRGASSNSKMLANLMFDECVSLGLKARKPLPNQKYWDCGFYICKNTNCPAILTENFFQDNKEDVDFLLSDEGKKKVAQIHTEAIKKYYNKIFKDELLKKSTDICVARDKIPTLKSKIKL